MYLGNRGFARQKVPEKAYTFLTHLNRLVSLEKASRSGSLQVLWHHLKVYHPTEFGALKITLGQM